MLLTRFCAPEELEALSERPLVSLYDHYQGSKGGSTSIGFCLSPDGPTKAWRYLMGIVPPFYCCIYDIPRHCLIASKGKYFGGIVEREGKTIINTEYKPEWCTTFLRFEWLVDVFPIESFVGAIEVEAARDHYYSYDKRNYNRKWSL